MNKQGSQFTLEDMQKTSQRYREKFGILEEFGQMPYDTRKDCKIGTTGGNLYISTNGYLYQSLERWWYKESRYTIVTYLEKEFSDYCEFLKFILEYQKKSPYNKKIKELINENIAFIEKILVGLEKMKFIYLNFTELNNTVDEISKKLNMMKNNFLSII